jgi:hypothetical protein
VAAAAPEPPLDLAVAAALERDDLLARLGSSDHGVTEEAARRRLETVGANVLRSHGVRLWSVLARQLRSFLLLFLLLLGAAVVSAAVSKKTEAGSSSPSSA